MKKLAIILLLVAITATAFSQAHVPIRNGAAFDSAKTLTQVPKPSMTFGVGYTDSLFARWFKDSLNFYIHKFLVLQLDSQAVRVRNRLVVGGPGLNLTGATGQQIVTRVTASSGIYATPASGLGNVVLTLTGSVGDTTSGPFATDSTTGLLQYFDFATFTNKLGRGDSNIYVTVESFRDSLVLFLHRGDSTLYTTYPMFRDSLAKVLKLRDSTLYTTFPAFRDSLDKILKLRDSSLYTTYPRFRDSMATVLRIRDSALYVTSERFRDSLATVLRVRDSIYYVTAERFRDSMFVAMMKRDSNLYTPADRFRDSLAAVRLTLDSKFAYDALHNDSVWVTRHSAGIAGFEVRTINLGNDDYGRLDFKRGNPASPTLYAYIRAHPKTGGLVVSSLLDTTWLGNGIGPVYIAYQPVRSMTHSDSLWWWNKRDTTGNGLTTINRLIDSLTAVRNSIMQKQNTITNLADTSKYLESVDSTIFVTVNRMLDSLSDLRASITALKAFSTDSVDTDQTLSARSNTRVPSQLAVKNYIDIATVGSNIGYYFKPTLSDLPGKYEMVDSITNTVTTNVSPALSAGATVKVFSYMTRAGKPGLRFLKRGVYDVHAHMSVSNVTSKTVKIYFEVWSFASSSDSTLRMTSELSDALTTTAANYDIHATNAEEDSITTSTRINVKFYAVVTGGGPTVTVTMHQGGLNNSRLVIPVNTIDLLTVFQATIPNINDTSKYVEKLDSLLTNGYFTNARARDSLAAIRESMKNIGGGPGGSSTKTTMLDTLDNADPPLTKFYNQFKAAEAISSGDFVRIVDSSGTAIMRVRQNLNKYMSKRDKNNNSGPYAQIRLTDTSLVRVLRRTGATRDILEYVAIRDTQIVYGDTANLLTGGYANYNCELLRVNATTFVVAYDSSTNLMVRLVTMSGSTMTMNASTKAFTSTEYSYSLKHKNLLFRLSDSRFILYSLNSSGTPYFRICRISGTGFVMGYKRFVPLSAGSVSTTDFNGNTGSLVVVDTGKFMNYAFERYYDGEADNYYFVAVPYTALAATDTASTKEGTIISGNASFGNTPPACVWSAFAPDTNRWVIVKIATAGTYYPTASFVFGTWKWKTVTRTSDYDYPSEVFGPPSSQVFADQYRPQVFMVPRSQIGLGHHYQMFMPMFSSYGIPTMPLDTSYNGLERTVYSGSFNIGMSGTYATVEPGGMSNTDQLISLTSSGFIGGTAYYIAGTVQTYYFSIARWESPSRLSAIMKAPYPTNSGSQCKPIEVKSNVYFFNNGNYDWAAFDEKYEAVGIAQAAISKGAYGKVATVGQISSIHSGLTIGQFYELDRNNGALISTGVPTPGSLYGLALSATELLLMKK